MSEIKLMDGTKTLAALVADNTNGLGALQTVSAKVTEELNGLFECELVISTLEKHFDDLACGSILKLKPNETAAPQLFRVYSITKPRNTVATVKARHISYDLNKAAVLPCNATGVYSALQALESNVQGSYEFTTYTDINNTTSPFYLSAPASFRAALGGVSGSILDTFGGEYEWDNLTVKLLAHRGTDHGVTIEYGKNLTDINQEENIENTYNAVLGFATVADGVVMGTMQYVAPVAAPKTKIIDFSSYFPDGDATTVAIDALAQQYINANNIGTPKVSIKVSFVPLYQTEEYKEIAPLERVALGDTVTVKFPKLNVTATAKVVKYVYDVNRDRYNSVEIGDVRSTLAATLIQMTDTTEAVQNNSAFLESYIANFTGLVANSMGLFKTVETQADGSTKVYLHNKPERVNSQYQWTINSAGFFVSQDYGATWSAGIDAQGNAVFNSLAANIINAMVINGSVINGLDNNGYKLELAHGALTMSRNNFDYLLVSEEYNQPRIFMTYPVGSNTYTMLVSPAGGITFKYNDTYEAIIDFNSGGDLMITTDGTEGITLKQNGRVEIFGSGVYFNGSQKW